MRSFCPLVLRPARGHATGEHVSCLVCPGHDEVGGKKFWGRGLHLLCASLAGGPAVSHLSTMRLKALGSPRVAHTQEPTSHPPRPLCPEAGSGSPPGGLLGGHQVNRKHVYPPPPPRPPSPSLASPSMLTPSCCTHFLGLLCPT